MTEPTAPAKRLSSISLPFDALLFLICQPKWRLKAIATSSQEGPLGVTVF